MTQSWRYEDNGYGFILINGNEPHVAEIAELDDAKRIVAALNAEATLREAIKPFADAARVLGRVAPDGIDDHVTVVAHIHAEPTSEYVFSSADFTRALSALKSECA